MASVYILKSLKNRTYYIGCTKDLNTRIEEHNKGYSKYTRNIRPLKLVFKQDFSSIKIAKSIELKLKRFNSRVIIENIIRDGEIKIGRG